MEQEQEQVVEDIVEEVIEEQPAVEDQPAAEEVVEDAPPAADLSMDFSDLGVPDAPPPQPQEPDYESLIGNIVDKVLDQQKVKLEDDKSSDDDDDMTYLSKKDLAEYEQKIEEKILNKFQEQQKAQTVIQQSVEGAEAVRAQYADKFNKKLAEAGFDLEQNPSLKNSAAMLFDNLKLSYAAANGRLMVDPATKQPVAVLTPQEMKGLVQQHWDTFSKSYLPGLDPTRTQVQTTSLSPAANGVQAAPGVDTSDDYKQFMDKKARGEETLGDALNLLLKPSGKK